MTMILSVLFVAGSLLLVAMAAAPALAGSDTTQRPRATRHGIRFDDVRVDVADAEVRR